MSQQNTPIIYRPPTPDDLTFIMSSWLKSYRNSDFANFLSNDVYYKSHAIVIQEILDRSNVAMIVDPQDPNHLYGYIVFENFKGSFVLHYIYIKYAYRNLGLCKDALQAAYPNFRKKEFFITHLDKTVLRSVNNDVKRSSWFIKKRDDYKMIHNIYLLIR